MQRNEEEARLAEARVGVPWRRWGPYLADRQWGTVREDYSADGDAWSSFSHDQARSRAYRWGEDGMAGVCDDHGRLCLALALWNGRDPILKERLFGLTNEEGNHGEDAKEYWFHVDNVPSHAWMRWQYKYPQAAFPYEDLVRTNRQRTRLEPEYELLDTGVFDDDRYFDVIVEHAKAGPEELLVRITVHNRGPEDAEIHLLPTLWFHNTWSWPTVDGSTPAKPHLGVQDLGGGREVVVAEHAELGLRTLEVEGDDHTWLCCENESNHPRLWGGEPTTPYPKDGIHDHVVHGTSTVNPAREGTKAAAHVRRVVPAGGSTTLRLALCPGRGGPPTHLAELDATMATRLAQADRFYEAITPPSATPDEAAVLRQALAGMLWCKQHYAFDVDAWLREHRSHPLRDRPPGTARNQQWYHLVNDDVISMPDCWEYPWYAAWDLAFHTIALALVDPDFAQAQLDLMLSEGYLHPAGQIPAYEWNFGDVNPPVHAFATLFVHDLTEAVPGDGGDVMSRAFLRESFAKLLLNFTWWVNRKDPSGRNLFEGGFLGLDNIGVFDRSAALPTGGHLEQADGSAWMALFSQNMLDLALVLAEDDPGYEGFVLKFVEHFFYIASAMTPGAEGFDALWDDGDGFFYDVLRLPDGSGTKLKVRSMVGLLPLCATAVIPAWCVHRFPMLAERVGRLLARNGDLVARIHDPRLAGVHGRHLLAIVDEDKLRRILHRMLDEELFLGPHGVRALSREHLEHPYTFDVHGEAHTVRYEPAESSSGIFGGNSNWRGPVWFPVNVLLIRSLLQFHLFYGDAFTIECPTGSGRRCTLYEVAQEISGRLVATFLRGADGRRPAYGGTARFQDDPHWRDLLLFHEYFNGDDGAGLGASHQTGWTGLVAKLIQLNRGTDAATVLQGPERPMARPYRRPTASGPTPT